MMVMMMKLTMILFVGAWPCMRRNSPSHRCKQGIPLNGGEYDDDCDDIDDGAHDEDGDDGSGHVPEATGANSPSTT